jgi:uncharacterized protein YegP (UPF0339 family)
MIAVLPGRAGTTTRWRLIGRTASGADVLAHVRTGGDRPAWRAAMRRLRDGDGELRIVSGKDGHFRWRFARGDGVLIAESPAVYRDAQRCRDGFATARRAARTALGPRPADHRPSQLGTG